MLTVLIHAIKIVRRAVNPANHVEFHRNWKIRSLMLGLIGNSKVASSLRLQLGPEYPRNETPIGVSMLVFID